MTLRDIHSHVAWAMWFYGYTAFRRARLLSKCLQGTRK